MRSSHTFRRLCLATGLFLSLALLQAAEHEPRQVCINFGCTKERTVQLKPKERQQLGQLFATASATAAEERNRIAKAIGWLESWVGEVTGTKADKARNNGAGEPGQLDCIAESKNSSRYLAFMEREGWLKFHRVKPRVRRAPFFFDSHWTAVIQTLDGQESYAVDSWFFANGKPASIIPLHDWYRKKDPDS